jgi:hypothetical protein
MWVIKMENSINEQIAHIETEVEWYKNKVSSGKTGWIHALVINEKILETLKWAKEMQEVKCDG